MSQNKFILHILRCFILAFDLEGRLFVDEKSECVVIVTVQRVPTEPRLGFRDWMVNWEIDGLKHLVIEIGLHWGGLYGRGDLGRENFLIFTMDSEGKWLWAEAEEAVFIGKHK